MMSPFTGDTPKLEIRLRSRFRSRSRLRRYVEQPGGSVPRTPPLLPKVAASSNNSTGYKGVAFCPKHSGSKKYELSVWVGGKKVFLGYFATAEQAALFYARREAGRDTSDLTAPPPPPPPSSTSAELPVYELSILTPEQMAAVPTYSPSSNFGL